MNNSGNLSDSDSDKYIVFPLSDSQENCGPVQPPKLSSDDGSSSVLAVT